METHVATRKEHRCDLCGRKVPIGARYFYSKNDSSVEHTNCLEFKSEPLLENGFNQNRKRGEVTQAEKIDNFGRLVEDI